jgi:AAA domain-containing protein
MRIAISGSHLVGKTTLAESLASALPRHELVPEPYHLLEEDGYEFAAMPSIEDFEVQLARSLQCLQECGRNAIFDRCPLDILGYLITHRQADAFQLTDWMSRLQDSMTKLDLIVFIPIEEPDRVAVPRSQSRLRTQVDAVLREIIVDDSLGFGVEVVTASGTPGTRLQQVVAHIRREALR